MPRNRGPKHWRQFECPDCPPARDHYDIRRWHKRVPDSNPFSVCTSCNEEYEACPIGEEVGVGVCMFKCDCGHEYSVVCEMTDTATCFQCYNSDIEPHEYTPLRRIKGKSSNKHSCSKCNGSGNCPNMNQLR